MVRRRVGLLLAVVVAMLVACTGVVLAQSTTPRDQQSATKDSKEPSGTSDSSTQRPPGSQAPLEKAQGKPVPGQYIVVLNDDVGDADQVSKKHGADEGFKPDFIYKKALKGYATKLSDAQLTKVRSKPEVKFVSLDQEVQAVQKRDSKDTSDPEQSSSNQDSSTKKEATNQDSPSTKKEASSQAATSPINGTDTVPTGVRRIEAATTTMAHPAAKANVAVIDTGIQSGHPDLNALPGKNCVNPGTNPTANDDNGHGTHVAGTIGAKNDGKGVIGVAPDTKQYAVKVLNSNGSGTWSQVICGIDWVTANASANGIKVANMSLGGGGSDDNNCGNSNADALHQAICRSTAAGVTYVVAAGNSAADLATFTPAAYDETVSVTAMSDSDGQSGGNGGSPTCRTGEKDDAPATFSNYATTSRDKNHSVAGPGVCIKSTWLNGGYNTISGTSMASPHLTGSVALCIGDPQAPTPGPCANKSAADIVTQLKDDTKLKYPGYSATDYGFTNSPDYTKSTTTKRGKTTTSYYYYGYLVYDGGY